MEARPTTPPDTPPEHERAWMILDSTAKCPRCDMWLKCKSPWDNEIYREANRLEIWEIEDAEKEVFGWNPAEVICSDCLEEERQERVEKAEAVIEKAARIIETLKEADKRISVQNDYISGKYSNFGYQREYLKRKSRTLAARQRLENYLFTLINSVNGISRT